ncbi:MAG TPA: hypothetical protein ENG82_01470, partial [Bacteroidetes bacterium]|nr:hypothetical protein [Bacteroidota bacterium]
MNPLNDYRLKEVLTKIVENTYTDGDLLHFIDFLEKIASGFLRFLQMNGKKIALSGGIAPGDFYQIAIDCIAPLFQRNGKREFVVLRKYFEPIFASDGSIDDLKLFIELKRLVIRSTQQELIRIFRERDPEGARILRNIRNAIQKASDLLMFENMSRNYVISTLNLQDPVLFQQLKNKKIDIHYPIIQEKLRRDLPLIPAVDLKNAYLGNYSPYKPFPALIRNLLKIVSAKTAFANYLTVDQIVYLTKDFKQKEIPFSEFRNPVFTETPEDTYQKKRLIEIQQRTIKRISDIIPEKYGHKADYPPEVISAFKKALINYTENYIQDRKKISHFHLLRASLPSLTFQDYRKNYR